MIGSYTDGEMRWKPTKFEIGEWLEIKEDEFAHKETQGPPIDQF